MRGWTLILTALMLAAPLAGCLDYAPLATILGSGDEITAMEARDMGDGEAKAWQRDARLVGIMAFEVREVSAVISDEMVGNFTADPNVGNGLAPAWGLGYASADAGESYFFVVHADGTVTDKRKEAVEPDDVDAHVQGWRVDSDDAVDAARGNATFQAAHERAGDNRTYSLFLFNSWEAHEANESDDDADDGASNGDHDADDAPDGTNWGVLVMGERAMAWATVNASTGDVVHVMDMRNVMGNWGAAWGGSWGGNWSWGGDDGHTTYEACHAGRLDQDNTEDAYRFPVSSDATDMEVSLEADGTLPTDGFTLVVTDPEGEEVARHEDGDEFEWSQSVDRPGEYAVTLTVDDTTVAVDYTLELWAGQPGAWEWDEDWDYDPDSSPRGWTMQGECP